MEVFVLRYNSKRIVAWLICARRIGVVKDVAIYLAKAFLKEKKYHFAPSLGIAHQPYQLGAYIQRRQHSYCIVDAKLDQVVCAAGLVALEAVQYPDRKICVWAPDMNTESAIMDVVREMSIAANVKTYGEYAISLTWHFTLLVLVCAWFFTCILPMLQEGTSCVLFANFRNSFVYTLDRIVGLDGTKMFKRC